MKSPSVFLSYRHFNGELAETIKEILRRNGIRVWMDKDSRPSMARRRALRKDNNNENALDTWLRSGVLRSHLLVVLVSPKVFLGGFFIRQSDLNKRFIDILFSDPPPQKLYRDASIGFYFSNLNRFWKNEWYKFALDERLGKDRLESWQGWEVRAARVMRLQVLLLVIEDKEDPIQTIDELIERGIQNADMDKELFRNINFDNIWLLHRAHLGTEVEEVLCPAILEINKNKNAFKHTMRWKRRFWVARLLSWPAAILFLVIIVTGLFIFSLVLLIADLFSLIARTVKLLMGKRK